MSASLQGCRFFAAQAHLKGVSAIALIPWVAAVLAGGPHLLGVNVISILGFALSTVLGLWLLWGVVRSGRL